MMTTEAGTLAAALARTADEAGRAVMRALHHAGLAEEVSAGSLLAIPSHEVLHSAKSVPEESAQGWARWGLVMYLRGVEMARHYPRCRAGPASSR